MADDPLNQKQFAEDVAASTAAGNGESYVNLGGPQGDFKMPSIDEVMKLIEQMDGISDEERASIRESLYNPQDGSPQDFLKRYAQPAAAGPSNSDYIIFSAMIAIIVLVFVLFGYKLYTSLMAKELKKQEKLKNKQSKKSKKAT